MSYSAPPPAYNPSKPAAPKSAYGSNYSDQQSQPLLDPQYGDAEEDDFDVGVTVSSSSLVIRHAFVRKVYSILFIQLLGSAVVGGLYRLDAVNQSFAGSPAFLISAMVLSFVNLGLVYWKRHSHPLNFVFLSAFTLCEAVTIGAATSQYDQLVILQALAITTVVFLGLTIFTFQSKYDFSSLGGYLVTGLLVLISTSVIGMFLPFSKFTNMLIAGGGCLIFSGYIVYDTFMICNRYSPDEFIMASVSLYLDFLNLFLYVLRLLNSRDD